MYSGTHARSAADPWVCGGVGDGAFDRCAVSFRSIKTLEGVMTALLSDIEPDFIFSKGA